MIAALLLLAAAPPSGEAFLRCTGIEEDAARLACFDRTAAMTSNEAAVLSPAPTPESARPPAPQTAPRAALPPAPAAAPEPERARALFGLRRRERVEPESLTAAVAELELNRAGKLTVTLADGQVWRQLSGDVTSIRLRSEMEPQTATIRQAAMGSYRMTIEPMGRTIRVKRVE